LSADDSSVPVYFAWETPDVLDIYEGVMAGSGDDAATAVEGNYFTADVLQMRPLGEKMQSKNREDLQIEISLIIKCSL